MNTIGSGGQCAGFTKWFSGKESACQCRSCGLDPWVGKIPSTEGNSKPTLVFLPGKSQGQGSLAGYSPRRLQRVGHD